MRTVIDPASGARNAYLNLVQDVIFGAFATPAELVPAPPAASVPRRLADRALASRGLQLATAAPGADPVTQVDQGRIWPRYALSMAGRARLDNARDCIECIIADDVPGDIIETGVWRGGASIYMRAVLKAWGVEDRRVWVSDSFEGLPPPDLENYPADATAFPWHQHNDVLGVSLEQVKANFASLGLFDDQVTFLKGFFKDSLPPLTEERWALMRLDGDLYESTFQALEALYPNLSTGGWVLIDDYGDVPECKQAVTEFRERHGIHDEIREADHTGVYWQRMS